MRAGADAAVPGLSVGDTIKVVDDAMTVVSTPERSSLVAVQTRRRSPPTGCGAHAGDAEGTDDAPLVEAIGGRVVVVPGEPDNRKITVSDDLIWARQRVAQES